MTWFKPDEAEPLKPGVCECDHLRCCHEKGKGACRVGFEPRSEENPSNEWTECACQIFILDEDHDDGDDQPNIPIDPEVAELQRMIKS